MRILPRGWPARLAAAGLAFAMPAPPAAATNAPLPALAHADGAGRLRLLSLKGDPVPLYGEIRVAGPGWTHVGAANPWSATGIVHRVEADGAEVWSGVIPMEKGASVRYEQRLVQDAAQATLSLSVWADAEIRIDSATYFLQLPVRAFPGAKVEFLRGSVAAGSVTAPLEHRRDRDYRLLRAPAADTVRIQAARCRMEVKLDRPRAVSFQDDREWGAPAYSLLLPFAAGPVLRTGETARLQVRLALEGQPDQDPAEVRLGPVASTRPFEGFGGNFIYGLDGPIATTLVERLAPVRARIEMPLYEWEPENDNDNPAETDWERFEALDTPGSTLRRRFELAALLAERGIPLIISVWDLPEWMYEGLPKGRWVSKRTVAPGRWPEVVESAAAYLVYLKTKYGVEPELFSFNEPEAGVRVLFTADQHRDMISRFGERFAALGLKTRLLLGDVSHPRGTESYGVYAISDPLSRRHIGGVGVHSWGGGLPSEFAAWAALARRLDVPLDVAEVGWDPGSWRTPHELEDPGYAIEEARLILDLLGHARPRSMLMWEYTDDYPLLKTVAGEGGVRLEETLRLRLLEQLIRLTPRPAVFRETTSSRLDVPAAALEKPGGQGGLVVHVANTGAGREVAVTGLPGAVSNLAAVLRSAVGAPAQEWQVAVSSGVARIRMPAWSVMSLHEQGTVDARVEQ